jgi:hypothetical protein
VTVDMNITKSMKKTTFFASLKSLKKGFGFGVGSGSIRQKSGSGDPDPHQIVPHPQQCSWVRLNFKPGQWRRVRGWRPSRHRAPLCSLGS